MIINKVPEIIIIGAGLGGLSAAIRLASKGFKVTVFEKNSLPGGKAGNINLDSYRFDTGPSLLTMPFIIRNLFEFAGENIDNWLKINKLENLCRYFYDNGTIINAYSDFNRFANEICTKTIDTAESLQNYLNYCKTIYDLTNNIFLKKDLYSFKTYANTKALKTLFQFYKIDPFRTMDSANRKFFKDEKLIQLFNRYATYNGSNPFKCPATLNIISHVEYNLGGYYLTGGMYSLTKALYNLALKIGVKFEFNSEVKKILLSSNRVKGIIANENEITADIVISNADVFQTYSKLLNEKDLKFKSKFNDIEFSSSAFVFYWGVNINSSILDAHNILFSSDYKQEFTEIFDYKKYPADPTIYIYVSSKFSPKDAPNGKENWFVMINAPNTINSNNINSVQLQNIKHLIIKKIKTFTNIDLTNLIECEKILTPNDVEKYTGSYGGSIYGISSNSKFSAFFREPNRSKKIRNLFFTGGSAHPGGGIPLVLLSAKITTDKIIQKFFKN
jgi:phytoene desaturase